MKHEGRGGGCGDETQEEARGAKKKKCPCPEGKKASIHRMAGGRRIRTPENVLTLEQEAGGKSELSTEPA